MPTGRVECNPAVVPFWTLRNAGGFAILRRVMNRFCQSLAVVVLAGVYGAGAMTADRYAAQVNSRVIIVSDVLNMMGPLRQHLMDTYSGAELEAKTEEAYTNTLHLLIERALILEDFGRQEQKLPDQVVDGRINEVIHDRFNNSRSAFFEALTEEHMTIEDWRTDAKDHITVSMLRRREVADKVVVAPCDVRVLYEKRLAKYQTPEQVHIRAIVLHPGASAEKTARELQARAAQGENFEALARQQSQGAGAQNGGDWGWLQPGDLRQELAAALKNMAVGQISPVVVADGDFYILKLEAHKAAETKPMAAVYTQLEEELRQTEAERIYKNWIKRLQQKYYVKIFSAS